MSGVKYFWKGAGVEGGAKHGRISWKSISVVAGPQGLTPCLLRLNQVSGLGHTPCPTEGGSTSLGIGASLRTYILKSEAVPPAIFLPCGATRRLGDYVVCLRVSTHTPNPLLHTMTSSFVWVICLVKEQDLETLASMRSLYMEWQSQSVSCTPTGHPIRFLVLHSLWKDRPRIGRLLRKAFTKTNQNKQQSRENRNFGGEKKTSSGREVDRSTMKHEQSIPEEILIK